MASPSVLIPQIRRMLAMSDAELAKVFGVGTKVLQAWASGKRKPSPTVALLLNAVRNKMTGRGTSWLRDTGRIVVAESGKWGGLGGMSTLLEELYSR